MCPPVMSMQCVFLVGLGPWLSVQFRHTTPTTHYQCTVRSSSMGNSVLTLSEWPSGILLNSVLQNTHYINQYVCFVARCWSYSHMCAMLKDRFVLIMTYGAKPFLESMLTITLTCLLKFRSPRSSYGKITVSVYWYLEHLRRAMS